MARSPKKARQFVIELADREGRIRMTVPVQAMTPRLCTAFEEHMQGGFKKFMEVYASEYPPVTEP